MWGSAHFVGYVVWKKGGSCAKAGSGFVPRGPLHRRVTAEVLWSLAGCRGTRPGLGSSSQLLGTSTHSYPVVSFIMARTSNRYQLTHVPNSQSVLKSGISDLVSHHLLEALDWSLKGTRPHAALSCCVYFSEALACWTSSFISMWRLGAPLSSLLRIQTFTLSHMNKWCPLALCVRIQYWSLR